VFGREELDKLTVQKQALLLESGLNRLALQAEIQRLRSGTAWAGEATRASRQFAPLLLLLAPLAGFLLARKGRRTDSWLSRLAAAVKWIAPLYQLWKRFSPARKEAQAEESAG
jgi:hypothetical protein